jgi:F0F1-type ATP synthase membrane subunit b/b'
MPETDLEIGVSAPTLEADKEVGRSDLSVTPPLAPVVSEQAREIQGLKTQLLDAERTLARVQKAATEYREQLTEAQADIAGMRTRWYAAEKARNAVSSQREVDSSSINTQLLRAQKELERAQQMARSDLERAATRIQTLETRLADALTSAAQAEHSQNRYRKRSSVYLTAVISVGVLVCGVFLFQLIPHRKTADDAPLAASNGAGGETPNAGFKSPRQMRSVNVESLSKKPFVPKTVTKSLPDALGRLNHALDGFPGLDQEAVLQQVQKRQSSPGRPICSFDWSNGQPSIVFGSGGKGQNAESWALDISRCADAIEQAH